MRKKTLDAQSFAGVSPSRARAHCNEHCLCVLLFFPDPDAPGTYNRQVKMRFPDDRPKPAFVMRLPNEVPKTTLTKSLTRTSPIDRSKWGPKIRGSKTTLQNRSNEQVPSKGQNKVPKNEGPKATLQNHWPEQIPPTGWNEVPRWRPKNYGTKIAHVNKSNRQVEMRFPKWSSQNFPINSLQRTNPIDRSKWGTQVGGPKTYEIAEVSHRQVEMRFPKTTAQKLSYKIAPLEQVPRNEVSKMRTPKICYKNRSQVPSTGRNEVPKTMAQNLGYKIAHLKKSHPSTGRNEVLKRRAQKTILQNRYLPLNKSWTRIFWRPENEIRCHLCSWLSASSLAWRWRVKAVDEVLSHVGYIGYFSLSGSVCVGAGKRSDHVMCPGGKYRLASSLKSHWDRWQAVRSACLSCFPATWN